MRDHSKAHELTRLIYEDVEQNEAICLQTEAKQVQFVCRITWLWAQEEALSWIN
jgi:hypothetical protein